jgi:hypothetical protein
MWIDLEALTDAEERHVSAVGRALMVAQHFEANCRDFAKWWVASGALEEGTAKSLSDVHSILEKLTGLMLDGLIKRLGNDREITSAEIAVLIRAKDARNYIAHEAVATLAFTSRFSRRRPDELPRFNDAVRALVEGDNMISSWSYMFHEKEPSPVQHVSEYPNRLAKWILSPL